MILALLLFASSVFADTPGQVINKVCPASNWFSAITKTAPPVCSQPTYADIAGSSANIDITGNSATTTAFNHTPSLCTPPSFAIGILASGAAVCDTPATGGITSINGQTAAAELLTTSESGTNFTISQSGSATNVFNLPVASSVNTGKLSSTDWSTFNGKQPAGNYITALTGDIVATGPGSVSSTIQPQVVSNSKLANMANGRFKARVSSGAGDPEDITETQATALLDSFVGDSGSGGTKGLVPAPAIGDSAKCLKGNGSFGSCGTGSIPDVLTTRGDLLTQNPSGTYVRKAIGSNHTVLKSDGTDPSWGQVDLTTDVTGTLPVANGGTNVSSLTEADVLFGGPGGTTVAQDDQFNWDNTEKMLRVGNATAGTTGHSMVVRNNYTNPTAIAMMNFEGLGEATMDSSNIMESMRGVAKSIVNSGFTDSGQSIGGFFSALRNANGTLTAGEDDGTLFRQIGFLAQAGHYLGDLTQNPHTNNSYGVWVVPYGATGTIDNMYQVFLDVKAGTLGAFTNFWGLYQKDANAKNYFAGKLGIRTDAPKVPLHVAPDGGVPNSALYDSTNDAILMSTGSASQKLRLLAAANSSRMFFTRTNGTLAAPTTVASGNTIGDISFQGYDGTSRFTASRILGLVDAAVSAGHVPGQLSFWTMPSSGALTEAARIDSNQRLGIGVTTALPAQSQLDISSITGGIETLSRRDTTATAEDNLGTINFWNNDAQLTTQNIYASIQGVADATITTDAAKGRLMFFTTGTAAGGSPVERLRINSVGAWGLAGANFGTAGQVLTSNGSGADPTWQSVGSSSSSGGGVTSINGQSDAAELITVGTGGTDFNITQSGTDTNVLNLPSASATKRGALTSADWSTFNGKLTSPLTTRGDLYTQNPSGTNVRLAIGANHTVLKSDGTDPSWGQVALTTDVSGVLPMANGGTNKNMTASAGAVAYSDADSLELSGVGSAGQIFQSAGTGTPVWTTATYPATAGTTGTILRSDGTNWVNTSATYPTTTTANRILYSSATNTIGEITSAATSALVTNSSSVPSFTSGSTANRLLRTDGTTVSFAQANLTTDVTGVLPIANGGTNNSSAYTAGSVVFSNGTSLTQNNANLFWDNTANANFLTIGTGTGGGARGGQIRLLEASGSGTNYIGFQASKTMAADLLYTFPPADSTGTQCLASDGSGTLSWQTFGAGTVGGTGTDNHVMRWDGTTNAQDSAAILNDSGALSGLTQLDVDNIEIDGNTIGAVDTNGNINLTTNGTGQILIPDGSATNPSIAFSSDHNTGLMVGSQPDTGRLIGGGGSALSWGTHGLLFNEDHDGTFFTGMYDGAGTNYMLYADAASGFTGFGTTASLLPQSRVDVSDTTGGVLTLSRRDTSATVDDQIGKIQFWNNDSTLTTQNIYASIEADADQTITTDAAAGRLVFSTTGTSAGGSPVERLRIDKDGAWGLAGNNPGSDGFVITSHGAGVAPTWMQPTHGEYGTGIDGSLTVAGNTTMTNDLQLINLTINGGVTLNTAGYRVYVSGTLTNNGTIANKGSNGSAGGVGGLGGAGAAAGTVGGGTAGGSSQIPGTNETECYGSTGGAGGGGAGGAGGTCTANTVNDGGVRNAYALPNALTARSLSGLQFLGGTGGGGGANDAGNRGGGGGGGGGVLIVAANYVATLGTLDAGGGNGGAGSTGNANGGGGGAGGLCTLIYNAPTVLATPVSCASGGTGGGHSGTGANGANGAAGRTVILRN